MSFNTDNFGVLNSVGHAMGPGLLRHSSGGNTQPLRSNGGSCRLPGVGRHRPSVPWPNVLFLEGGKITGSVNGAVVFFDKNRKGEDRENNWKKGGKSGTQKYLVKEGECGTKNV